jgi:fructose-1,6-bisphosphatase/inositol monophosphatase family enzyme
VAALIPIVREAGGKWTTIDGHPSGGTITSALASNSLLHDQAQLLLNG